MDPRALAMALLFMGLARIAWATEPLLPRELPGVMGGAGTVGVTDFAGGLGFLDDLESVAAAIERIRVGELIPDVVVSRQYAIADVADPQTNSAGGPVLAGAPLPFPSDTDANDDDFISIAKGTLWVPESGTYTIQVRSDEGMGLRIIGEPFRSVHGRGALDRDGSMIVSVRTNDADARGVIELSAGPHAFEFLMWERDRNAYWEITSAVGAHPEVATARWLALGDSTILPPLGGAPRIATLVGPARVINVADVDGGATTDITVARERVLQTLADHEGIVRDDVTTIVLDDHDGPPNPWRPGYWVRGAGASYRWPLNDPAVGGDATDDFNDFSSGLFGKLQVDDGDGTPAEHLLLTFALFSSDGSQFHIAGRSFLEGNELADLSYQIGGDTTLSYPGSTLTADALGLIMLQEGVVYDWEGFHYENRADAGYEIWVAQGDQLGMDPDDTDRFLATFFPLSSTLQELVVPGNRGLAFVTVDPPITGDYNLDGQLGAEDLDLQSVAIAAGTHPAAYDLNGDARVDYGDRQFWVARLKGSYLGDANLDGQFNSADFVRVFAAGRYETTADATWSLGDWNGDRLFDSADFVAAFADGGYEAGPRLRNAPVAAEPDIGLWTLVGMAAVAIRRRRARRSSSRRCCDTHVCPISRPVSRRISRSISRPTAARAAKFF